MLKTPPAPVVALRASLSGSMTAAPAPKRFDAVSAVALALLLSMGGLMAHVWTRGPDLRPGLLSLVETMPDGSTYVRDFNLSTADCIESALWQSARASCVTQ